MMRSDGGLHRHLAESEAKKRARVEADFKRTAAEVNRSIVKKWAKKLEDAVCGATLADED